MPRTFNMEQLLRHPKLRQIALGIVGAAVISALFGTDVISYVKTLTRMTGDSVRSSVSVQFELERARGLVDDLVPEIRTAMLAVAEDELALQRSEQEVEEAEQALQAQRQELLRLRNDIDNLTGTFKVGSRNATPEEVREELRRRFGRYQTHDATLEVKRQIVNARSEALLKSRNVLQQLLNARQDLATQIAQCEARLQSQEIARQNLREPEQVARCQQLIQDIRHRLDIADQMAVADLPLEDILMSSYVETESDIGAEIDRYFRGGSSDSE